MVRFLADESCDYAVVRTSTGMGHEVLAVAELSPRADDESVIGLALRERCILLTEDKDFGQLVHASGLESTGVVLLLARRTSIDSGAWTARATAKP